MNRRECGRKPQVGNKVVEEYRYELWHGLFVGKVAADKYSQKRCRQHLLLFRHDIGC
jgi:hypothetical protein